jgi:hypothetical protein
MIGCSDAAMVDRHQGVTPVSAEDGLIIRGSTGKRSSSQAGNPPARGRIREMPRFLSRSATLALVASFGQVQ